MTSHGKLGEFVTGKEDWKSYTERLQQYFTANDIEDAAKQRAILLSSCGAATYRRIKDVIAPQTPTDVSFVEIVEKMTAHFQPPPSEIMQRYRFNTRVRQTHETVSIYLAQLKQIAEYCNYKETLPQMLRDRLVCGIGQQQWQRRLLAEEGLTYDKAVKLLLSMEAAEQEVKDLGGRPKQPQPINPINRVRQHVKTSPAKQPQGQSKYTPTCFRCGGPHKATGCSFQEAECHYCHKKGHLATVCKTKQRRQEKRKTSGTGTHKVAEAEPEQGEPEGATSQEYQLYCIRPEGSPSFTVDVNIDEAPTRMEVDTGAALSIISLETYRSLWPQDSAPPLQKSDAKLRSYTGEVISVAGTIDVDAQYEEQKAHLPLVIVAGSGPSLLGRNWLHHFRLDWSELHHIQTESHQSDIQAIIDRHPDLFREGLGKVTAATAKIYVDRKAKPRFLRARPVPYALQAKVEAEIDRLVEEGVLEPVQFSQWATPVVPVLKQDGRIRLCGDYKLTINQVAQTDTYPLPRIEDLFASLSGGKVFSKLDLTQAYLQIPLDEESKKYTTLNTHKGLFQFTRLPFGVASAPSIFQRIMEGILQGLPGVCVYLDDILVSGKDAEEHRKNLEAVFTRLEQAEFRLKLAKCFFMLASVEYLGFRISGEGLHPTPEKIRAVHCAPPPQDVTLLKSFIGLVNYYGKFLPDLSSVLAPLYQLLQKNVSWIWGKEQEAAFVEVKSKLTSDCLLVHYDPMQELVLACDASPYGVGAVLSHRFDNGQERPIAFASRSLAPAEKNYSQVEKEGLAIIYGIKKFHMYLFGRHFEILSDHKPLQHMFNAAKGTPTMASARLQRWSIMLGAYDYSLQYKPGPSHGNADLLSRLPVDPAPTNIPEPAECILLMEMLSTTPLTAAQIKQWSRRDPTIAKVVDLVLHGWQHTNDPELKPYQDRREELSVLEGCLLWAHSEKGLLYSTV